MRPVKCSSNTALSDSKDGDDIYSLIPAYENDENESLIAVTIPVLLIEHFFPIWSEAKRMRIMPMKVSFLVLSLYLK